MATRAPAARSFWRGDDFIVYNQLEAKDGSVIHQGDNRTGEGDGDDEQVFIDLTKVAPGVGRILIIVSIDQADTRGQNFGMVRGAYCRVVNNETDQEVVRYDLTEDAAAETCMAFSELYRENGDWRFRAIGQGYASGLYGVVTAHGVVLD